MITYKKLAELLIKADTGTDRSKWTILMDGDLSRKEFMSDRDIAIDVTFADVERDMTFWGVPIRWEWLVELPELYVPADVPMDVMVTRCPRLLAIEYKTRAGRTMYIDDEMTDPVWKADK